MQPSWGWGGGLIMKVGHDEALLLSSQTDKVGVSGLLLKQGEQYSWGLSLEVIIP